MSASVSAHYCRFHTHYRGDCLPCRDAAGVAGLPIPTRRDLGIHQCPRCHGPAKLASLETHVPGAQLVMILLCSCA